MQSYIGSIIGLVLSVSVGAEPLLEGRVRLSAGQPAAGVQVRLFDLTDLRRSVGTTTDGAGYFTLSLQAFSGRSALPDGFALGQNYPNPFNPSTIVPYQIPTATHVRLEVFNLLGQRLATLVDAERSAGAHTAQWDGTDAAGQAVGAGVYIYRLLSDGQAVSRRMVLIDGQAGIPAAGTAGPMRTAALGVVEADGAAYGLTVAGAGLVAYVDPAFRVGIEAADIVVEEHGGSARMKLATGGILGDVTNDEQVDAFDALYVALYSKDPSITLPNNGDISLGDVNGDGTVNLGDALLLAAYSVNPSDPSLPAGIGRGVRISDDHSNTRSGATSLSWASSLTGQIELGGDVDYFRVQVGESGTLTVYTTGDLDTKGELQNSAGSKLASNDDGGSGNNFRIERAVSAGTYYIKVEAYSSLNTGSYTIHASFESSDDHSNTRSGATSLSWASSLTGQIELGGDVDYFRVQVGESGTLTVYTTGDLDTKGELQNSAGSKLASNDDGGSRNNFRIERAVSAGTYYIKVEAYSSSGTGSYTIHASFESRSSGGGGNAISLSNLDCSGEYLSGNSSSATITITGTAYANTSVTFVTLTGYANGEEVGITHIDNLIAGESEDFRIHGIVSITGPSLNCRVDWESTIFGSAKLTAGATESSKQVRVQGNLSPSSALLNRKRSLD